MGILLLHQIHILILQLIDHELTLRSIAELDKRLQNAAPVVLEAELGVLRTNRIDALLDEFVLLGPSHLFLLHQQLVVGDLCAGRDTISDLNDKLSTYPKLLDEVGDFLLLPPVHDWLLTIASCFLRIGALAERSFRGIGTFFAILLHRLVLAGLVTIFDLL